MKMKAFNLEGRTAVITGASRGIGLAIAQNLARNGAQCILVSRKAQSLETAAAGIREKEQHGYVFNTMLTELLGSALGLASKQVAPPEDIRPMPPF